MIPSQRRRLEMLLRRKRGTTSWEVMQVCRTTCPGKRISELRQAGWTIRTEWVGEREYMRYFGEAPKGF